jgi:hypothetical protein
MRRKLMSLLPVMAAFLVGASLVGVATGHSGFQDLLHSGHSDKIKGTLTARRFRFSHPKAAWEVLAPISIRPVDPEAPACLDTEWHIPADPEAGPSYVSSGAGCWMAAQVMIPDDATITKMVWHLRDPSDTTPILMELVSFDALGAGGKVLADDRDTRGPAECADGCHISQGVDKQIPGFNPVINQRRSYTFRYKAEDAAIKTTRVLITYKVETAGPK